jgi:hypothetical protein
MRNITVTVTDDLYRLARIWAALHNTTVSALVREFLENLPDFSGPNLDFEGGGLDAPGAPPLPPISRESVNL